MFVSLFVERILIIFLIRIHQPQHIFFNYLAKSFVLFIIHLHVLFCVLVHLCLCWYKQVSSVCVSFYLGIKWWIYCLSVHLHSFTTPSTSLLFWFNVAPLGIQPNTSQTVILDHPIKHFKVFPVNLATKRALCLLTYNIARLSEH